MTLHLPLYVDKEENVAAKSIKLWELGSSHEAAISCKKQFTSGPSHPDFISEIDNGKEIIRCSGWRIPSNMSFVNFSPFLTFDISIIFRESIKTLEILPREINAYNETYRIGGITSYVHHRRHYVGYIFHNGYFLYYDGIPSSNPVLKKYEGNDIEGDISFLCYFPCDDNSVEIKPEVSNSTSSKGMKKDKRLTENNSAVQEDDNLNNTVSDFLLAQALTEMENEKENIYERPKGKTYRRRESKDTLPSIGSAEIETNQRTSYICSKDLVPLLSDSSSFSDSIESDDPEINMELIQFIDRKKDFILKLVSAPSCCSELHTRSDRLVALHRCKSLTAFESNAINETNIIRPQPKEYIGTGFNACESYITHIFSEVLLESRIPHPDDICDYGGSNIVPIKMKKFNDIFKTIEYIIFPEVITEFFMETKNITYKDASLFLHGNKASQGNSSNGTFDWSTL